MGDVMLVLTRRRGQTIRVGPDITFTVLSVAGENVRIGVAAPRELTVDREEVHERKVREAFRDRDSK
jgi:carbon storage regulator